MNHPPPAGEPVCVPQLHQGDIIHIQPHEVFQHTEFARPVGLCYEADVVVTAEIPVGTIVVICWRACDCPSVCGAVVYDADDYVMRSVAAA